MREEKITVFIAFDGERFADKNLCLQYEAKNKPKYTMFRWDGGERWEETNNFLFAEAVLIPTTEALEQFKELLVSIDKEDFIFDTDLHPGCYVFPKGLRDVQVTEGLTDFAYVRMKMRRLADAFYSQADEEEA